ncbi:MAG: hypothetical protein ACRCVN_04235 [Spirochaetia bacterium]
MGKTQEQVIQQIGEPRSIEEVLSPENSNKKIRLLYKGKYFGHDGKIILSINKYLNTVSLVEFYTEGGNYIDEWTKKLQPKLGKPYTQDQWLEAVKNPIHRDRTPELIQSLYSTGIREWPITKTGYLYEVATVQFSRPRQCNPQELIWVEATCIRIFDTKKFTQVLDG